MKGRQEQREEDHDLLMKAAYIAGKLPRAKKPPKLTDLLVGGDGPGPVDKTEEEIREEQKALVESGLWPEEDYEGDAAIDPDKIPDTDPDGEG